MAKIKFENTHLNDLKIVKPFLAEDNRGYFIKAFEINEYKDLGLENEVSETFESCSKKNVVRGLHFQVGELAQAKLVRVISGRVYDVCVDLREDSSTFGKWYGEFLDDKNHYALFVPKGFAHGFLTISDEAIMSYTAFGKHNPDGESGIYFNDEELNQELDLDGAEEFMVYAAHVGKIR